MRVFKTVHENHTKSSKPLVRELFYTEVEELLGKGVLSVASVERQLDAFDFVKLGPNRQGRYLISINELFPGTIYDFARGLKELENAGILLTIGDQIELQTEAYSHYLYQKILRVFDFASLER